MRPDPKETIWSQQEKGLIAGLVFFGAIGITPPAYAYLDPGKGSMLVQMLLGGVTDALVVGKRYWHHIKAFFGRRPPKNRGQELRESLDAYWMVSLHEHRWGTFAQLMRPAEP